jgi:hypothetical protein
MTAKELEDRLRATLREIAEAAPLANPNQPRPDQNAATNRGFRFDFKVLAVIVGLLFVITTIVTVGLTSGTSPSHSPPSSTTTSSTPTGPIVVPNTIGLQTAQAASVLQSADITNSIDNVDCGSSIAAGHVVGQAPPAGSHVAPGSRINLRIECP